MQYELFETLSNTIIEVSQQAELPKILTKTQGMQIGSYFIPYQLRRSKRHSIGFLITDQGLRITAPRWVNLAEIKTAIVQQQRWILAKLQEQERLSKLQQINTPAIWTSGTQLPFLGRTATLHLQTNEASHFDSTSNTISLKLSPDTGQDQCKKHVQTWLKHQAHQLFSEGLTYFAQQLNVQYHSFALSNAKTQWGSCNAQRKIRLNWRLIHLPVHLINYVVAHELAHLFEMNHSPRFWAVVESVFPDYLAARKELRRVMIAALPKF